MPLRQRPVDTEHAYDPASRCSRRRHVASFTTNATTGIGFDLVASLGTLGTLSMYPAEQGSWAGEQLTSDARRARASRTRSEGARARVHPGVGNRRPLAWSRHHKYATMHRCHGRPQSAARHRKCNARGNVSLRIETYAENRERKRVPMRKRGGGTFRLSRPYRSSSPAAGCKHRALPTLTFQQSSTTASECTSNATNRQQCRTLRTHKLWRRLPQHH